MNDYDDEVHRNSLSATLFALSALVGFGIFCVVCGVLFSWAES